jgi:hypothetical protein
MSYTNLNIICEEQVHILCRPLMYLINKLEVFSMLTRWLLLFLQYDFKIIYKPGRSHLMADALSRLPNQTKPIGVPNQTCDVHLFILQPKWLHNVYEYLT